MDLKNEPSREDLRQSNRHLEGNDKAPGEEEGKGEKVANADLKGKTVDGNPADKKDQPLK
ncbi:MAG: hypothetical protein EOO09_05875 [Chitinophagaceae bacterium]|nr:MAG: hypothetical protein EOO09_05875 [Chitinophagaceae bacterium]